MMEIEIQAELLKEAKESIEAAKNYKGELEQRLQGLNQARNQINGSAVETRDALQRHFKELKASVIKLLDERLILLLQEVDKVEEESIKPLDDCQKLIEHGVNTAEELLREGEVAVLCGTAEEKLGNFTKKALQIQLDSLPEVPSLVEVPCLSVQLDESFLGFVKDRISTHGAIASRPPVQIEELTERPGGILVRWCKDDDDFVAQEYRLQFCKSSASNFEDVYVGPDTEFVVLHIDTNVGYTFRVCARGEGRMEWSPWSIPQTGHTTLSAHEWIVGCEGFSLSSRRDMALRNDSPTCGVLYSKEPTYTSGQTLTFRMEAAGLPDKRDSIGVCVEPQNGCESLQRDKAVCISSNGAVFVNGKEMTNQLPCVSTGSSVTFDMEVVSFGSAFNDATSFKLRVIISSGNREVVFDWLLDQPCEALYFGCSFVYPGWKVLVF
ncbi:cytokine receptor-like factor 3 [Pristis pectinata]|uniref:cytokine receptor-like factor 3 n=1 Tax=Pristis pectinata TaxID=685728 RepID=UPI00223DF765|nr:cytokine receptor-like factor 3 [Pristis pectinata]XP_051888922.1 cytokine receptor-like factor 3 [Pristis pectinata]